MESTWKRRRRLFLSQNSAPIIIDTRDMYIYHFNYFITILIILMTKTKHSDLFDVKVLGLFLICKG